MSQFPAVRLEGGLLGPDTLEKLLAGELTGQKPKDFGLDNRRSLTDEIAGVFAEARAQWEIFRRRLERLPESDLATSVTRDVWLIPFLSLLGYELRYNARAYEIDGATFAISHRAGEAEDAPPVHIVGVRQELGRLAPSGRPRLAPHSLVQEYLNRSDHLWGIVSNGLRLRLLRDCTFVRRQAYAEFDLQQILEEQRFNDFAILYRLLHRSRLPHRAEDAPTCLLEQYYRDALEQGGRVRDRLRDGVEQCLKRLANGFLERSNNTDLRRRIDPKAGSSEPLTPEEFYRQLLRLVYRFLFLLVSEERGLISDNPLYRDHYSVTRLRRLLDRQSAYTEHEDLWCSLRVLWRVFSKEELANLLKVSPLNGELFAPLDLDTYSLSNRALLEAFWHLSYYREDASASPRRVNYAALDVEELGSVYESLLEYHPQIDTSGRIPRFELAFGSERKSTGSYYTPPELVAELIRSALEPVLAERLAKAKPMADAEQALLSLRVLDPACGSGHFLLAAARRLGKELAKIRTGEEEPAPECVREAIRDVVSHCIYGVDKNPLAVELCRVALWLEAHCAGKPLTFLDHHIKCGDSLVGVVDLKVLERGIPHEAFDPASADSREAARSLKRRNRAECQNLRKGQLSLPLGTEQVVAELSQERQKLEAIQDDSPADVRRKQELYSRYCQNQEHQRLVEACNLWTAAFFQLLTSDFSRAITTKVVVDRLENRTHPQALATAAALALEHRFFHWPLELPEIFERGGFDVILGNPPWERIKLQEEEFFAVRDPQIARAANAAARKRLIAALPQTNPDLWEAHQRALHAAESASRFLRGSGQYPLTGRGDINTYSVFAERVRSLLNIRGRAGIIVPTGIATDATNQFFFADLAGKGQLASLFDFENRQRLFPAVDSRMKFCLLTLAGSWQPTPAGVCEAAPMVFAFFATHADHLRDPRRVFTLTADDIARINPNTRTLPVFRTRQDADLTRAIYQRVPVLVNEHTGENSWGVRFLRMFDMSNDSHLFRTRAELEQQGYRLVGNVFVRGEPSTATHYLPLYGAKMIWHYDHRYGTYEGVDSRSSTQLPTPDERQHADPHFVVLPWYWVPAEEVTKRLGDWQRGWLVGFRDVTNATNERTAIFSLLPRVGAGHTMPIVLTGEISAIHLSCFLANLNVLIFDWALRQKIGGTHLTFFILRQLPIFPPTAYTPADLAFIVPRALELTYTAWDLKPFADDVWNEADDGLRAAIHAAWDANRIAVGRHEWRLPSWISAYPEIETNPQKGIPFPPFRWDEDRRAVLRAELDAYYAQLYGLTRKQLRYILDPADLTERELADILDPWEEVRDLLDPAGYAARVAASTFPGETFRVLKEKELSQFGEYRTRRLVLEAWEKLAQHSIKA
ncbi:Eco57I restriction-modification methylase domain-containing protein [Synechococcus sp. W55.1]|uniref:Eco57I restriction-modification methylase domain-containing protein n=1 Tax=Synechococcus sp. W55.1 TaxID=2964512 RepID=UPI0039C15FCC